MTTIVKLGYGTIKVGVKGVKFFADVATGKAPDFRIDEGEYNGPNSETHVHFGDGDGEFIGEKGIDFLLDVAPTNYHSKIKEPLEKRDYIFSDEYTLKYLSGY